MSVFLAFLAQTINSATTTSGEIIDTLNATDINIAIKIDDLTTGDLQIQIFESDDSGMAGATLVPASLVKGGADDYDTVIGVAALANKQTRNYHLHRTMIKRFVQARLISSDTPVYDVSGTAILGSLTRSVEDDKALTLPV